MSPDLCTLFVEKHKFTDYMFLNNLYRLNKNDELFNNAQIYFRKLEIVKKVIFLLQHKQKFGLAT